MEVKHTEESTQNIGDFNVDTTEACTEIFIEEISRGQKLIHRHRLNKAQISIGRDYSNDIILADPHICPTHLTISHHNSLWKIADNNSINGTFLENPNDKKKTADQHIVESGDIISVGKSQLKIVFNDYHVSETIRFSAFENLINLMRNPLALLLSISLFTLVAAFVAYLGQPIELNVSQLLVNSIGISLLLALWPASVALVSHLTKHDARFMTQLGISFAFFNLMWFSDLLENIIAFNSAKGSILTILITVVPIALSFCLFWFNCNIGFHMAAKRQMVFAASMTCILFGGSYLIQYSNKPEFNVHPEYDNSIMAPAFLFNDSSSVDEFIEQSSKLFAKAQRTTKKD